MNDEEEIQIGPNTRFQLLDIADDFDEDDEMDVKLEQMARRRRNHVSRGTGLSPT